MMKSEDQQATNIDHEALRDAVKQFLHDHSPQTEVGQKECTSAVTSSPPSGRMRIFTATGGLSKVSNSCQCKQIPLERGPNRRQFVLY